MKKTLSLVLALAMLLTLVCTAAFADEVAEPEGGKKFDGTWAIRGMRVTIVYEEEGYRVFIESFQSDESKGTEWAYNCYYKEDQDALESITSSKQGYTLDPDTFDALYEDPEYDDFDEEGKTTLFKINAEGKLTWADGRNNEGADLEFQPIGDFEGMWRNDAEGIYAEISWEGLNDEETFYYTVYVSRGQDADQITYYMQGLYDWETGKLEATGTMTTYVANGEGGFDPVPHDDETVGVSFSKAEDGKLFFGADNSIVLDYVEDYNVPEENS